MAGFVKLHRQIIKWEWYTDTNTKSLFLHCLLSANHKPVKWQGIMIEAGSFITSLAKLAQETGMTIKEVRVALNHLKATQEVAHKGASKYSVITVVKWADYQFYEDDNGTINGTVFGNQKASQGQAKGIQRATNKNDKNEKNEEKYPMYTNTRVGSNSKYAGLSLDEAFEIIKKIPFSIPLTEEEVQIVKMHDRAKWKEEPDD